MNRKPFTQEDIEYIKEKYSDTRTKDIAAHLNRNIYSIYNLADRLGLKKSEEFNNSPASGRKIKGQRSSPNSEFPKGHKPWNTGLKGVLKGSFTSFKKGHLPHNTLSDGVIRTRKNKHGTPYQWIRLGLAKWEMLHVHTYKKFYGEIPEGHIVIFKNKNTMDCSPENLLMISKQQHAANTRNTDGYIAARLASTGRGKYDKDLAEELKKHPELIDLKRNQLKLNQTLKAKK